MTQRKTIGLWVRSHPYEEWSHYGDCTAAEYRNELKVIRFLGLYVRTVRL